MTAAPYWCRREHMGGYMTTLILCDYQLPSIEEVRTIFEDKWKKESPKETLERLEILIAFCDAIKERFYTIVNFVA